MDQSSIMQYFAWEHLPQRLQETSKVFAALAKEIDTKHANNPEKSVALRKLLEAKDAAIRSKMFTNTAHPDAPNGV